MRNLVADLIDGIPGDILKYKNKALELQHKTKSLKRMQILREQLLLRSESGRNILFELIVNEDYNPKSLEGIAWCEWLFRQINAQQGQMIPL